MKLQSEANFVVSIEPQATHPLHPHFLLSKVVDYLASGRPILAMTASNSMTAAYCSKGYGWAFAPDDVDGIAAFIEGQLKNGGPLRTLKPPPPPSELEPLKVTRDIASYLQLLAAGRPIQEATHDC